MDKTPLLKGKSGNFEFLDRCDWEERKKKRDETDCKSGKREDIGTGASGVYVYGTL